MSSVDYGKFKENKIKMILEKTSKEGDDTTIGA
jgi:hypothetical protein